MDDRRRPTARATLAALLGIAASVPPLPFEPVSRRGRSAAGRRADESPKAKRARLLARWNRRRNAWQRGSGQ